MCRIYRAAIAGDADSGSVLAGHGMAFKAKFFDHLHDPIDIGTGRIGFHYNKHNLDLRAGSPSGGSFALA